MDINYIDGFVALILAYAFYKGFSKGLVKVLATFTALILGVLGAIYFSDVVAIKLSEHTDLHPEYISIAAFTLTFIGIIVGVHFVAQIVDQAVKAIALGPLNKVMGGVFNGLKMVVVLCFAFYVFDFVNHQVTMVNKATLKRSYTYDAFLKVANATIPLLTTGDWYTPNKWKNMMEDITDEVVPEWPEK